MLIQIYPAPIINNFNSLVMVLIYRFVLCCEALKPYKYDKLSNLTQIDRYIASLRNIFYDRQKSPTNIPASIRVSKMGKTANYQTHTK